MQRPSITFLLVLGLVSAQAAPAAHGQETAGGIASIRSISGRVELRPAGNPPKPFVPVSARGLRLTSGDTIRTGRDGRMVIQFDDGSRIYCFEETEFTVTEAERNRAALGIEVERYRSRLVKVARGSLGLAVEPNERLPTEIQSPTVVIGVRGTVIDPFQVNPISGETRVGLKRGRAWGYTPDGQAAFRVVPGLIARLGRDAKGRPTVLSERGPLGLITRDHRISLQRGQGVFLDLNTLAGRAAIGALPRSVGKVLVEAGGTRARLAARQALGTRIDRRAGRLFMNAIQGRVPITGPQGTRRLLVPGKPFDLPFRPPAFEQRLLPGPRLPLRPPKGRSLIPAPGLPRRGVKSLPEGRAPRLPPRLPRGVVPRSPGIKGRPPTAVPPSSRLRTPATSPLKRLLQKALPSLSGSLPRPREPKDGGKGSPLPSLKSKPTLKRPSVNPFRKAGPSTRTPSTKPPPATRTPLFPRFKPRTLRR